MSEAVVTALITGGLALAGVIFSNIMGNRKIENQLFTQQAVTDAKIEALSKNLEELKEEVKKHNNFAGRIPVLEEQIKVVNHRIDDLEKKVG